MFKRVNNFSTIPLSTDGLDLGIIRRRLVDQTLLYAATLATFFLIINTISFSAGVTRVDNAGQILAFRALSTVLLWVLAIFKPIPSTVKALGLTTLFYTLFTGIYLTFGINGPASFILISIPILVSLILGPRLGLITLILNSALVFFLARAESTLGNNLQRSELLTALEGGELTFLYAFLVAFFSVIYFSLFSAVKSELFESISLQSIYTGELENVQKNLNTRIKKRVRFIEYSTSITQQLSSATLNQQTLFEDTVNALGELAGYPFVQIYQLNPLYSRLYLKKSYQKGSAYIDPGRMFPLGSGIIGYAGKMQQTVFISDLDYPPVEFAEIDLTGLAGRCASVMAVPIINEGELIGVLSIQHTVPDQLDGDDIYLLQVVSEQLAGALRYTALYEQLSRQLTYEEALEAMNIRLQEAESMEQVLEIAGESAHQLFGSKRTKIVLK